MPPVKRGRRGKGATGRTTASGSSSGRPSSATMGASSNNSSSSNNNNHSTSKGSAAPAPPPVDLAEIEANMRKARDKLDRWLSQPDHNNDVDPPSSSSSGASSSSMRYVFPSNFQRRGVFECDVCRSDISQDPRLRCAVCEPEYDVCLECAVLLKPTANHDPATHPYRVCDSTRRPVLAAHTLPHQFHYQAAPSSEPSSSSSSGTTTNRTADAGAAAVATTTTTTMVQQQPPPPSAAAVSWTAEEDLRLLAGIKEHGLGNWVEIAEGVPTKTAKKCQERYLDDFLGRYGHILPPYTIEPAQLAKSETGGEDVADANSMADATGSDGPYGEKKSDQESSAAADGADVGVSSGASAGQEGHKGGSGISKLANSDPSSDISVSIRPPSKRRAAAVAAGSADLLSAVAGGSLNAPPAKRKRYRLIPTEAIPGYDQIWPQELSTDLAKARKGQWVHRDALIKAEQAYTKALSAATSSQHAQQIHRDWVEKQQHQQQAHLLQNSNAAPLVPTVFSPRVQDTLQLPGSELAGYMPRRNDLDVEWENEAEEMIADMEFLPGESKADQEIKLDVLRWYNRQLDVRQERKEFLLRQRVHLMKKQQAAANASAEASKQSNPTAPVPAGSAGNDRQLLVGPPNAKLPRDEQDFESRMRLWERFQTPAEHEIWLKDLRRARALRKEIALLQQYRRWGFRTTVEIEVFERDKQRRLWHRKQQQVAEESTGAKPGDKPKGPALTGSAALSASSAATNPATMGLTLDGSYNAATSLWRQYRTSDRRNRKSLQRGGSGGSEGNPRDVSTEIEPPQTTDGARDHPPAAGKADPKGAETRPTAMDIDPPGVAPPLMETEGKADGSMMVDEGSSSSPQHTGEETEKAKSSKAQGAVPGTESTKSENIDPKSVEAEKAQTNRGDGEKDVALDPPAVSAGQENKGRLGPEPPRDSSGGTSTLAPSEAALCLKLRLAESDYRQIKLALIQEAFTGNLLDSGSSSSKKSFLFKLDVQRRGDLIDFYVRAGWVSAKLGQLVRNLPLA